MFKIIGLQKRVGYLQIVQGLRVAVYKKPSAFHRWMMRVAFGWTWIDEPTPPDPGHGREGGNG